MKLFKISTIALAMALTGWVACGNDGGGNTGGTGGNTLPSTGGTVSVLDAASGSGGAGGSGGAIGTFDSGVIDTGRDIAIGPDASDTSLPPGIDGGIDGVAPNPVDGGTPPNICTGLTAAQCHDAIINAATDPSVSALDPGANPPVPYPNCSAL